MNMNFKNTLQLHGALLVQRGQPVFVTGIRAQDVVSYTALDTYNPNTGDGYQRDRSPTRVNQAADYYVNGGLMPNPLLFNIREDDFEKVSLEVMGDRAGYEEALENGGNWMGVAILSMPLDLAVSLWLYDGQHREGALEVILPVDDFEDFPVPCSITLGLSSLEEMKEFYEVNNNAKAVKTDLAWTLLRKQAESDPDLAELLELKGKSWQTKGQEVVEELMKLDGPWKGSIQLPNQKKQRTDRLTLNLAQFIRSLQPVLAMDLFKLQSPAVIAQVLNAYWTGVAQVMPEPFDPSNNPKNWVIQKGPGAISLHRVLPQVIEVLRARGEKLGDPEAYADVMEDLPKLEGEIVREDGTAEIKYGADFWLSGPEGVASQFTGDAGRKRLGMRIQALLPKPSKDVIL